MEKKKGSRLKRVSGMIPNAANPLKWRKMLKSRREGDNTPSMSSRSAGHRRKTKKSRRSIKEGNVEESGKTRSSKSSNHVEKTPADPYEKEKASLLQEEWYHGLMPRDEIVQMLKNNGDFLVRRTEVGKTSRFALSVFYNGRIRHLLLNYDKGMWAVRSVRKTSLAELIDYYIASKKPVQADGTRLLKAVKRPPYYILHDNIIIGKRLGGGAFGDVHMGIWKKSSKEEISVAIKKFKGVMKKKERVEFVREASIMRQFHHPNIVGVLGVAAQEQPLLILMDLSPNGALNSYLKKHPETNRERLLRFITDAARGMCYLSASKVIHRDVAARNCLLGFKYEVKISDFGLSVSNSDNIKVQQLKNVPVRWLSPETLRLGVFSSKSDVWSFGVLIWEVFSYCKTDPFPGLSNAQARGKIQSGKDPMSPPDGTPEIGCDAMRLCFTQNPVQRADFESLLRLLSPSEEPPRASQRIDSANIQALRKAEKKASTPKKKADETPAKPSDREKEIKAKVARKRDSNKAIEKPDVEKETGKADAEKESGKPDAEKDSGKPEAEKESGKLDAEKDTGTGKSDAESATGKSTSDVADGSRAEPEAKADDKPEAAKNETPGSHSTTPPLEDLNIATDDKCDANQPAAVANAADGTVANAADGTVANVDVTDAVSVVGESPTAFEQSGPDEEAKTPPGDEAHRAQSPQTPKNVAETAAPPEESKT